jgi:hypothetical protein
MDFGAFDAVFGAFLDTHACTKKQRHFTVDELVAGPAMAVEWRVSYVYNSKTWEAVVYSLWKNGKKEGVVFWMENACFKQSLSSPPREAPEPPKLQFLPGYLWERWRNRSAAGDTWQKQRLPWPENPKGDLLIHEATKYAYTLRAPPVALIPRMCAVFGPRHRRADIVIHKPHAGYITFAFEGDTHDVFVRFSGCTCVDEWPPGLEEGVARLL